ncbi:type I-E CRISPR-associated protein Cas6/Cse3/CasE [Escherichia coli]|nr:type I-E CRISPR-associated protein Cas6/Cse3/CasE [Escherichia coli]
MTFFDFWGKTRRGEKDGGDDYHLLCWHSLDVAAMGYLMVKRNCFGLADYFRQLGISDKEQAAQFFAWLLCWHDIGKFARSFQQLYLPPELKIQEGARKNYEKISHSTLGYWLWNHYLSECQELLPSSSLSPRKLRRVIEMWMPVTTGHHGRPPDRMDELDNFLPEDKAAARDFLLEIKPLFPLIEIPAFWDDDEGIELIKHLSWYISATVVLADWTGSSTRFFPRVAHPMDIKGYWQKTLVQAQNALTVFPLKAKVAPFNGINTLFPFIENPTPLQQKVLDLDISQQGPQLFILEDVTGAGKTEAALILAHRLIAAGKAQGLFFGLPTMATANAMYDRLVKTWLAFYSPESRPSLVLAHSARTLMDRFNESLWSGDLVGSEEPDEQTFSQGCAAWFADSNKKALLAEIGVGTLDQAMMAVMPFKHNNLRLLGLSNKILLADEIHACDAYMSCILEGLIERQARGGNSVILLSATLSQQQRDKLVAAFARGTEGQQEAPFLEKDDYPWLTHVTKSDVNSHRVATRKDVERSVSVGWLHSEQECIARIESAVSQGKCIAWIRNSVDDAIKVHRQLLARGVIPASSLSLFHSRFAFSDRQRIETETLARFGKYCSLQRASQVIVCTQVIEQSVDIDLDEMISDLAPIDLLIQRAGRLQRHTGQLSPAQLLHLVDRGEYVMHQWLWDLFPGGKERQFLYRREELQGAFRFFVLSQERPAESETFTIECRSFVPELRTGQQLCFNLRANPTICKAGKRQDLLMEAKRQVRGLAEGSDVWLHQQQAALDWLAAQGERSGFTLLDTSVDAYRQQQLRRENSRQLIQFSSVDYTGMLTVTDPGLFLQRLSQGYGKSRAFGCGLMLIKPGAEA